MTPPERFDAAYYRRFYGRRPVHGPRQIAELATAVTSFAAWWKMPVRSVLDIGAGKGYWRDWLVAERPKVHYHGIDASPFACRRYGHEQADLATWTPPRDYDLVICQSVLQYLADDAVVDAGRVIAGACRGLLYVEVPTRHDRSEIIDSDRTDMNVHWRTAGFYRRILDRAFIEIGAGLWVNRAAPVPFFEMERARV